MNHLRSNSRVPFRPFVLDWEDELTRKLGLHCFFVPISANVFLDVVSGKEIVTTDPTKLEPTLNKYGYSKSIHTNGQNFPLTARTFGSTEEYSISWLGSKTTANSLDGMVCGSSADGNNYIWMNNTTNNILFRRNAGTTTLTLSNVSNGEHVWRTITSAGQAINYYAKGSVHNQTAGAAQTFLIDMFTDGYSSSGFSFVGDFQCFVIHNKVLTPDLVALFHAAPFRVLKPVMPFIINAGGGGTTYNVSASLGLSQGLTQAGTAQAVGGLTLSQSVGCSDTGGAQALGSGNLGVSLSDTQAGTAQALTSQTYNNSLGFTATAIIAFFVDVTFSSTMGQTHQGTATGQGSINLDATLDKTISALAQTLAQITLSTSNGLTSASGQTLSDSISLGVNAGLSNLGTFTFAGSITLSQSLADQINATAQASAGLNLGAQIGLSAIAQAAAQAGITLSQVVSVVTTGTTTIFGITTPDGRIYTVEIDTRTLTVAAESRTYTVN